MSQNQAGRWAPASLPVEGRAPIRDARGDRGELVAATDGGTGWFPAVASGRVPEFPGVLGERCDPSCVAAVAGRASPSDLGVLGERCAPGKAARRLRSGEPTCTIGGKLTPDDGERRGKGADPPLATALVDGSLASAIVVRAVAGRECAAAARRLDSDFPP